MPVVGLLALVAVAWYVGGWIATGTAPGTAPPPPTDARGGADDGAGGRGAASCGGTLAGGAGAGASAGAVGGPLGMVIGAIAGFGAAGVASSRTGQCGPRQEEVRAAAAANVSRIESERGCLPQRPCGTFRFLHPEDCRERDAENARCRPA